MAIDRRNQKDLKAAEWKSLVAAIDATHGVGAPSPSYREFVRVHVDAMSPAGMGWAVHTMPLMGMDGRNFLAWHRWYLSKLEARLRVVDPAIAIPYWDWKVDHQIPPALDVPALLQKWSVSRKWHANLLPTPAQIDAATAVHGFVAFQHAIEGIHNPVHNAVGGTMASSSSPADPLFWLHHANVDRLWANWQASALNQGPPNTTEVLQPTPLFGVPVSSVLSVAALGYQYK